MDGTTLDLHQNPALIPSRSGWIYSGRLNINTAHFQLFDEELKEYETW